MLNVFFCYGNPVFNIKRTSCVICYQVTQIFENSMLCVSCGSILICIGNVCLEITFHIHFHCIASASCNQSISHFLTHGFFFLASSRSSSANFTVRITCLLNICGSVHHA